METREYSLRNIVFLAKRLRKQLWNEVETQVAIEGVSALQWSVLSSIATGQGDSVSDLSQTFDHDPGALSRSVNQLVGNGLLSYVPSTDDRRRIYLQMTDEGKRVFESLKERIHHATGAIRATLSEEEFCQLEALLAKANAAIENLGLASA